MTTAMQLITQSVASPPPVQTYADKVNAKFANTSSNFVSLDQRLADSLKFHTDMLDEFNLGRENVEKKFSQLATWKDLSLCRVTTCKFSDIVIDTTMQRELDFGHVIDIIKDFNPLLIPPVCVYENSDFPGKYICWDCQHSVISLYVVMSQLFPSDLDQIEIPVAVYSSQLKSEMRLTFIGANTKRRSLDQIDLLHQKIYSYRTDGTVTDELLKVEAKQRALENAKMFATNRKFGDIKKPGALTALTEFSNDKYNVEITEYFCKWFYYICNSSRPVATKESWMMYEYFNDCVEAGITVDEPYIYYVAASLNKAFNGSFSSERIFTRAKLSYTKWFKANNSNMEPDHYPEREIALPFLFAQIGKYLNGPVPPIKSYWTFSEYDLF